VDPLRTTPPSVATGSPPVAYLDSSALVKLIAHEPETADLRVELARWPRRVSSLLAAIEVTRTARRLGALATPLAPRVLAGLQLLAIDPIAPTAMQIGSTLLRSLDAIHLATADSIRAELAVLITYDHRMLADAQALGLPALAPR
jgi:predicted nucleic acid-binding protein